MPAQPAPSAPGGLVKITGSVDVRVSRSSFMALGDATFKMPIRADVLKAINNQAGDTFSDGGFKGSADRELKPMLRHRPFSRA
jgi:hypothetical protein